MTDIQPGTVVAERYRLVRPLERGGMGAVWLADHLQLEAPVAVKFMMLSVAQQAGMQARFEREAKAAAQIRSPYVVHIYDHGIDDGTPFIVMEFLEGEDLRRRTRGKRMLAPSEAVRICEEVCKGLGRAHELGIVHRDLKPANIFLAAPDAMVKILDFGIAKETGKRRVVDGETTTTGQVLGSPHYMSPEHARGLPVDGRSDLWSLAVILYRAMTGERPFDGHDIGDLIVRICTDPIPKASALQPELGPAVDAFFDKAFQRDPALRFQDARAFADGFRDAFSDHVLAERSGSWAARVSHPGAESTGSNPSLSGPMGTPTSSRFRALAIGGLDEDEIPTRTPGDTFAAATAAPRSKRRLVGRLVGAAAVVLVGAIGAVMIFGGDEAPSETASSEVDAADSGLAGSPAAAEPAASAIEPDPSTPSPEEGDDEDPVEASASMSASAEAPPVPQPVPRPIRPRPVTPKPAVKPKVDLGY